MEKTLDEVMLEYEEKLEKSFNRLISEFGTVRAGRANPHILDKVFVDYYGTRTPISQTSNITVADARTLVVSPWDATQIKSFSATIIENNLGVSVSDDGRLIRLSFPILTEERRKEYVKEVKKILEDCNIGMRGARKDVLDDLKEMKKDGMSEDEFERYSKDVQKYIDNMTEKADQASNKKINEIMEI